MKAKAKAFTLIELLVVVAIIGILAAVGVNTFSGFQEKAKISATKANHKTVVKYIKVELMKCELGEATIFKDGNYGPISCTGNSTWSINNQGGMRLRDSLFNNSKIFSHMNAFDNTELAVQRQCSKGGGGYGCLGMVYITEFNTANSFAGGLHVKTCFKEPCNADNSLLDQINVSPN